jgi:hypothetical protein
MSLRPTDTTATETLANAIRTAVAGNRDPWAVAEEALRVLWRGGFLVDPTVVPRVHALATRWEAQADGLQRQAMRTDITEETGTRKAERAAGMRTCARELREELR